MVSNFFKYFKFQSCFNPLAFIVIQSFKVFMIFVLVFFCFCFLCFWFSKYFGVIYELTLVNYREVYVLQLILMDILCNYYYLFCFRSPFFNYYILFYHFVVIAHADKLILNKWVYASPFFPHFCHKCYLEFSYFTTDIL